MKKILSIVIPVFNEENNIVPLYRDILKIKKKIPYKLEIIFVNDGSTDNSREKIIKLLKKDKHIRLIEFTKNYGQTAAFDVGIKQSTGTLIVTMDADMQNDPQDIVEMFKKINEGNDVVVGWRKSRHDTLEKKLSSLLANKLRRYLTGETIHDSGCSLRIYKNDVFTGIDLYGEMHRFIPAILYLKGYRIAEIEVNHRSRLSGKSKYGFKRIFTGFFDLLFISFLLRYSSRPLQIFGSIGGFTFLGGIAIGIYLTIIKIFLNAQLANRPLLILGVLLMVLGVQFLVFGILAELMIRIYYKTHMFTPYQVRKF